MGLSIHYCQFPGVWNTEMQKERVQNKITCFDVNPAGGVAACCLMWLFHTVIMPVGCEELEALFAYAFTFKAF